MSSSLLFGQLLLGLINGSFYALLAMGVALIFGMLGVINVAQGSFYMLGAFTAWALLHWLGLSYWWALILAPLAVALLAIVIERSLLQWLYSLDHIYGFLLTFGVLLVIEGTLHYFFGSGGRRYPIPAQLQGGIDLGFMYLPFYRAWIVAASVVVCLSTWLAIERTRLGSHMRAATENPDLTRALGINVPLLMIFTFGLGAALAALSGVLAAPIYHVSPHMGGNLLIVVFAVVVIGGLGSILGSIVTGLSLGVVEGLTKVVYPEAANTVIFAIMVLVLMIRPAGLFGVEK
jgi:branched-chain amino acid transport system permease protein